MTITITKKTTVVIIITFADICRCIMHAVLIIYNNTKGQSSCNINSKAT